MYRSVDNSVPPVLGIPCSREDCHSPPQPNVDGSLSQSPVKPLLVGRAFAGPMSPAMVSVYTCVWCGMYLCMYVCGMRMCAWKSVEHKNCSRTF